MITPEHIKKKGKGGTMICECCKKVKPDWGNEKMCEDCWGDLHCDMGEE
jgi:hypothetical protein